MFMSGGAGYVLSKEALRRFIKEAIPVSDSQAFNEDVEMGVSLKKANVVDGCSLDNQGQSRFFPMHPRFHLKAIPRNDWFWHYMLYKNEKVACADKSFFNNKIHVFAFRTAVRSIRLLSII